MMTWRHVTLVTLECDYCHKKAQFTVIGPFSKTVPTKWKEIGEQHIVCPECQLLN